MSLLSLELLLLRFISWEFIAFVLEFISGGISNCDTFVSFFFLIRLFLGETEVTGFTGANGFGNRWSGVGSEN